MSLMFTLILSLLLLLVENPLAQKDIPDDIRKKVREAHTFDELLSVTQLSYASHLLGNVNDSTFNEYKLQPAEIQSYTNRMKKVMLHKASTFQSIIPRKSNFRQNIDGLFTFRYFVFSFFFFNWNLKKKKRKTI